MSIERTRLTLVPHARGKRSAVTCELKCGNQCAHDVPNTSTNDYFRDIASAAFTRRSMLGGTAAGALALMVPGGVAAAQPATTQPSASGAAPAVGSGRRTKLQFNPIAPVSADVDALTVPEGFAHDVIIRWGDPLFADSPAFDPNHPSAAAQEKQFGYNCDYLDILTLNRAGTRGLLVSNHEYTNENIMFPPTQDEEELKEQRRTAIAAHGFSIVELTRSARGGAKGKPWEYVRGGRLNRRIHGNTPMRFTGPAAGSDLLKTKDDPSGYSVLGMLNNCSGGTTPWGTILTGEENWNQYFVANPTEDTKRYGIGTTETGRKWWTVQPRFDARQAGYENEPHRFGYIVEIDPMDPNSTPMKHTNLGRFKHEGANIRVARDGRVVAYSGDDERFEYIYKFVSRAKMRRGRSHADRVHNMNLLGDGDLYVAKFTGDSPAGQITGDGTLPADGQFDGSGVWLPLVVDGQSKVPGMSVAEVLVFTRVAADKAGATKMDRPEDVQPSPVSGKMYAALTNNTDRGKAGKMGADEANPRVTNRHGHVLELTERWNDATATTFHWNLLLVCGDPASAGTYFGGYAGPVSPISCPDNLAFDSQGTLWISTDGQPGTLGFNDALHKVTLTGPDRGKVEQFLAVPVDAETCGPVIHDEEQMVFVNVQHPGEDGTWDKQRAFFPDYAAPGSLKDGAWGGPRPSVVQVYKSRRR